MDLFHTLLLFSFVLSACSNKTYDPKYDTKYNDWENATSVYDFMVQDFNGTNVPMTKYKGKVLVIVNVPEDCLCSSRHFFELNSLGKSYYDVGLRILAFPCSQFNILHNASLILECGKVRNSSIELMGELKVNGENAHPLYKYLKSKQPGFIVSTIKWKYTKFVINRDGKVVERWSPFQYPNEMMKSLIYYLSLVPTIGVW